MGHSSRGGGVLSKMMLDGKPLVHDGSDEGKYDGN